MHHLPVIKRLQRPVSYSGLTHEGCLPPVPRCAYDRDMKRFVLTMFVLLTALPAVAAAQIYSWTNAQGVVVYSDRKPPQGLACTRSICRL
ncbi:DUF4124 domain-containing protein [Acidihalobacter ferrooxydans]|uniref:DUF4124 domain-containing protein n=1 Tax=Acidihalobacter ferrooxydans TaxID=1765967 RepID=A0A1P8UDI1_9GAMM|nr:DUF4124 domain-containing protein [Acidihalobacter ferrooxydans]APZ41921.1 hypothetical protein BW247_01435 [Acidihalobacter ferrooxydans]